MLVCMRPDDGMYQSPGVKPVPHRQRASGESRHGHRDEAPPATVEALYKAPAVEYIHGAPESAEASAMAEEAPLQAEESAAAEETGKEDETSPAAMLLRWSERKAKKKTIPPIDESPLLTGRLVSCKTQSAVRSVMADAYKSLTSLRLARSTCDEKTAQLIKTYIRRMEKVISRAGKKIKDLDEEALLRRREKRAREAAREKRARAIREERKTRTRGRKLREFGYLQSRGGVYIPGRKEQEVEHASKTEAAKAEWMSALQAGDSGGGADGGGAVTGEGGAASSAVEVSAVL
ncbi:hypothetical protein LJC32_04680 [Oscillospiraceae bacterium OttesenSCG-928-F05]|nr:hypothetical protein [Oscillospiraceae bacterium OttesenSCG-928-F05]